jgi:hypothetical protein
MATTKKSQPATVKRTVKRTAKAGAVVKSLTGLAYIDAATGEQTPVTVANIAANYGQTDDQSLNIVGIATAFRAAKYSQTEALAAVGKANGGAAVKGFSKGSIGRAWVVAAQVTRDDLPKMTPVQARAASLAIVAIANVAGAPDVAAAVDLAIKSTVNAASPVGVKAPGTGARFVNALKASATAAGKRNYADTIKPAGTRGPQGAPALTDGKKSAAGKKTPETAAQPISTAATLAKASLSDLLAEIDRRVNRTGFTVISSDLAAFESIAAAVQAARDADRVVTIKG